MNLLGPGDKDEDEPNDRLIRAIIQLSSFSAEEVAKSAACSVEQAGEFLRDYSAWLETVGESLPGTHGGDAGTVWRVKAGRLADLAQSERGDQGRKRNPPRLDLRARVEMSLEALGGARGPLEGLQRAREVQIAQRYLLAAETQLWDRQAAAMSVSLSDQLEMLSLRKRLNSLSDRQGSTLQHQSLGPAERQLHDAIRDWTRPMPTSEDAHQFVRDDPREEDVRAGDYGILRGIPAARSEDLAASLRPALRALALECCVDPAHDGLPRVRQEVLQVCRHVLKLPQPGLCIAPIAVLAAAWDAAELAQPILQVLLDGDVDQYLDASARNLCLAALARLAVCRASPDVRRSAAAAGFYVATAAPAASADLALLGPAALLAQGANRVALLVRMAQEFFDSNEGRASFLQMGDESMRLRNLSMAVFSGRGADIVGRELDAALVAHPAVEALVATMALRQHEAACIGDAASSRELFIEPHPSVARFTSIKRVPLLRLDHVRSLDQQEIRLLRRRFQDLLTRQEWADQRAPVRPPAESNFKKWLTEREVDPSFLALREAA